MNKRELLKLKQINPAVIQKFIHIIIIIVTSQKATLIGEAKCYKPTGSNRESNLVRKERGNIKFKINYI